MPPYGQCIYVQYQRWLQNHGKLHEFYKRYVDDT